MPGVDTAAAISVQSHGKPLAQAKKRTFDNHVKRKLVLQCLSISRHVMKISVIRILVQNAKVAGTHTYSRGISEFNARFKYGIQA